MGTPEFPDLGKHCSVDDCKQIDFLPFTCDRCSQVFCLQHRGYTKHLCPNANQKDVTVLICPLCAKSVRLVPNEDPNITWESHVNSDCDPSNYQKATKKKRCPVPGCKETLTFSNTIRCRDCTKEHCLKHRFGPDHKCIGPKKPDPSFPFVNLLRRSQKAESVSNSAPIGSSWWGSSFLNAASNAKASAEAGMLRLSNATTEAFQKARDGIAQSSSRFALMEQCVQCQARFSTVSDLIKHAERCHQNTVQLKRNGVTIDICPKCSKGFQDPVLLVEHVERDHGGTSKVVHST
ncbi:zinc finger AN1 and C2H2 domain-containing stress-associated protein 16-like [Ananas comosus]|uniref:Zinc finger AN1 and C2H2 domain-containing stress-associated protein 16-like n=1 Tax=Ananas comosus TaxID=4615 RepID=A0A6P5G3P4_ANACO|nr:zinc finger AN1 and C2H2 domain-containing stress-associated protein 16-like [Ananas comosus]